jgi:hypothetical protein
MIFPKEEIDELASGFVCFAYDEMQTKGWKRRRHQYRREINLINNDFCDWEEELTFSEMLEKCDYNMDLLLTSKFVTELTCAEWFDAYYYHLHPELLEQRDIDSDCMRYSALAREFKFWLLVKPDNLLLDDLNHILGFDVCLK